MKEKKKLRNGGEVKAGVSRGKPKISIDFDTPLRDKRTAPCGGVQCPLFNVGTDTCTRKTSCMGMPENWKSPCGRRAISPADIRRYREAKTNRREVNEPKKS